MAQGGVGWAEVQHWLWPLYTERWGTWRYHRLGLSEVPYADAPTGVSLPPPPPLLYGEQERGMPAGGSARHHGLWQC